jgi:hypothetical protein
MIERNAMTMLLLSINAKGEPFPNEAFDTIGQFNHHKHYTKKKNSRIL